MKRLLVILFLLTLSKNIYCQTEYNYFTADSISPKIFDSNFFVFGEMHFNQRETSLYQLKLIDDLVKRGAKNITIYVEAPPSSTFFIRKYYQTQDSAWILKDTRLSNNFMEFIHGLNKYNDRTKFKFIPIDLEFKKNIKLIREFKAELLVDVPDSLYFSHLRRISDANSRRALRKEAKRILNDSVLQLKYNKVIDSNYLNLFYEELNLLSKYGIIRGFGISRRKIVLREKHMAQAIDKFYEDSGIHILTIGRNHIIPKDGNKIAGLFLYMDKFNRKKFVLMPIIYSDSIWLRYNKKVYPRDRDFPSLLDDEIFDLIILPPRTR